MMHSVLSRNILAPAALLVETRLCSRSKFAFLYDGRWCLWHLFAFFCNPHRLHASSLFFKCTMWQHTGLGVHGQVQFCTLARLKCK